MDLKNTMPKENTNKENAARALTSNSLHKLKIHKPKQYYIFCRNTFKSKKNSALQNIFFIFSVSMFSKKNGSRS